MARLRRDITARGSRSTEAFGVWVGFEETFWQGQWIKKWHFGMGTPRLKEAFLARLRDYKCHVGRARGLIVAFGRAVGD